jgi:uncharacterized membrane protein YphA (DoxX/SURF4 family)
LLARTIQDAAVVLLGLLAGAMLLIAVAFVGYWQSLDPETFLTWFATHAHRIGGLMIPLGVAATAAAIGSAVVTWRIGGPVRAWALTSAGLAVLVVVVYFAAHAPRNTAFAARSVAPENVSRELGAWATWHWVRVVLGLASFYAQLLSIRGREATHAS